MLNTTIIKNPYYDEFVLLAKQYEQPHEPRVGHRLSRENLAVRNISTMHDMFDHREEMVFKYSFSVPHPLTLEWIGKELGQYIVEIGAGTGYWAYLFHQMHLSIMAYDKYSHALSKKEKYYPVLEGDESTLLKLPDFFSLFLCWPGNKTPTAYNCMKNFKGSKMGLVGDIECCGDDRFHDLLENEWQLVDLKTNSTWPFINDVAAIYQRK